VYMPSFGVDILQVCAEEHVFQGFGDRPLTRRTDGLSPWRGLEAANAENISYISLHKNIRYNVCVCRLPRKHKNISFSLKKDYEYPK
jgi:hypothetical protein